MSCSASQLVALLLVALYTMQTEELVGEFAELHKAGALLQSRNSKLIKRAIADHCALAESCKVSSHFGTSLVIC